jgi:hypothetical protein
VKRDFIHVKGKFEIGGERGGLDKRKEFFGKGVGEEGLVVDVAEDLMGGLCIACHEGGAGVSSPVAEA